MTYCGDDYMDTFVGIFQGLPFVIVVSFIFGAVALIRLYIMKVPGIRRLSIQDRRQSLSSVSFPLHDTSNKLIAEDRRKLGTRRLASYVTVDLKYNKIH